MEFLGKHKLYRTLKLEYTSFVKLLVKRKKNERTI